MTSAVDILARAVDQGVIDPGEIDNDLFNHCFWSFESTTPDLLIRTSGEIRLSDFLLWQSSHTVLSFTPVLWPEFSIWHLIQAVFYYQRHQYKVNIMDSQQSNKQNTKQESKCEIDAIRMSLRHNTEK